MKILLINPPGNFVREPCCEGTAPISPPYELSLIAGKLKGEHEIIGLDASVKNLSFEKLKKEISKISPDVVISSVVSMNFENDLEVLRISKDIGCKTIMIMNQPIFQEEIMKDYPFIDISVLKERETTIEKILTGKKLNKIKGIIYRHKKKIIQTPNPKYVDYDTLSLPYFEIFPDNPNYKAYRIISSRYCPFKCNFCFWGNRPWTGRSGKHLCDELEEYFSVYKRVKFIFFIDQAFTLSKRRVLDFCDELKRRGIVFEWGCDSRVDTIDEEMLEKMHAAGCRRIFYGIEHVDKRILKEMNKNVDFQQAKRALLLTKKHDIKDVVSFIIGYPSETEETIKRIKNFILETLPDLFHISFLAPLPGTIIYEIYKSQGMLTPRTYREHLYWSSSGYATNTSPISLKYLTKKRLEQLRKEIALQLLFRPYYSFRLLNQRFLNKNFLENFSNLLFKLAKFLRL